MPLIKYFAEVFSGDCIVSETEFKFVATGTSMKIIRNEYVGTQGYPDYWVPRRLIDVYDESKQVTLPCCLTTTYYAKDEGVVVEDDTSFGFETDYIPVIWYNAFVCLPGKATADNFVGVRLQPTSRLFCVVFGNKSRFERTKQTKIFLLKFVVTKTPLESVY